MRSRADHGCSTQPEHAALVALLASVLLHALAIVTFALPSSSMAPKSVGALRVTVPISLIAVPSAAPATPAVMHEAPLAPPLPLRPAPRPLARSDAPAPADAHAAGAPMPSVTDAADDQARAAMTQATQLNADRMARARREERGVVGLERPSHGDRLDEVRARAVALAPGDIPLGASIEFEVTLLADGALAGVRLVRSSGRGGYDRAAEAALLEIYRGSPALEGEGERRILVHWSIGA